MRFSRQGKARWFERDHAAEAKAAADHEKADAARRELDEKAVFEASLGRLSPLARELEKAVHNDRWENDGNAFKADGVVEGWIQRLEADPQPDAIARLRGLLDRHFPGLLANPDLMKGKKKDTPVFKERWRKLAKRLNALWKQSSDSEQ